MKRAYLLIFNGHFGTFPHVQKLLNQIPEILDWRYELPNTFIVISEVSANDLFKRFTGMNRFSRLLISEISENRQGLMSPEAWKLMNDKSR